MIGGLSIWHLLILVLVVVLVFGAGKIPRLMKDMGQGINAFKRGLKDTETPPAEGTAEAKPAQPGAAAQPAQISPPASAAAPAAAPAKAEDIKKS